MKPDPDGELFGWNPTDAANRALQAVHGLTLLSTPAAEASFHNGVSARTIAELQRVPALSESEQLALVRESRRWFFELLTHTKIGIFSARPDRIWRLFIERHEFTSCKLRANLRDILECFDLEALSVLFAKTPPYFHELPLSSELVLGLWTEGLRADLVIPPRLLVLDMILMLVHARREHELLEESTTTQAGFRLFTTSGRLDSYARQVLILSTSVIDNILVEYGARVIAIAESSAIDPLPIEKARTLQDRGVTARLRAVPELWCDCLGRPFLPAGEFLQDMLTLIEIRNRLVHPDGRVNCWRAFQFAHMNSKDWRFTSRIQSYLEAPTGYRIAQSNIGFELSLARFCVDTVILTVDYIHELVFRAGSRTSWLDLPRVAEGNLDLDAAIQAERLLKVWPG